MRAAIGLARRGLGTVAPNPNVGCVIVRPDLGTNGRLVGRGWTQPRGRPHAETEALARAGGLARGAHVYVTLEPCSHQGQTSPCADALIAAGVTAVTIAAKDPDPRVSGQGIARLQAAGIEVRTGLMADDARQVMCGFLSRIERYRPWITLKTATTLDGAIAAFTGTSQWITGPAARRRGHLLRAQNDAILTGMGTVKADDPTLTCRLVGLDDVSPLRIVLDPAGELSTDSNLVKTASNVPVWQIVRPDVAPCGGDVETMTGTPVSGDKIDLINIMEAIASRGINRVLVEAGGAVSAAFLQADLVDEIAWFRHPSIMGADALNAFSNLGLETPDVATSFERISVTPLEEDVMERYLRKTD